MGRSVPVWSALLVAVLSLGVGGAIGGVGSLEARFLPSVSGAANGKAGMPVAMAQADPTEAPISPSPTATMAAAETPSAPGPATSTAAGALRIPLSPTAAATATPPSSPAPPSSPTPPPPTATPAPRVGHIGLQAGHWDSANLPDELSSLRTSTGAEGAGWRERDINLDIATRTAKMLEARGFRVDLLPATVPERYQADVFLALHGDGNGNTSRHGFKVARASTSVIPQIDDALVAIINRDYGRLTGLPRDDASITNNMRYYFAFFGGRNKHAVAPTTPASILEMGFLTNAGDRRLIMESPDLIANAIAESLASFFQR